MCHRILAGIALSLTFATSHAALYGRAPLTPGLADWRAYYDDVLGTTWLADANYARTTGYDDDGVMTLAAAEAWIASLNAAGYLGVSDWRLPTTTQPDPTCSAQTNGLGWGFDCTGSEMGRLSNVYFIRSVSPVPFSNVGGNYAYWSATAFPPFGQFVFGFYSGYQSGNGVQTGQLAWAVRTGEIDLDGDGRPSGWDNCTQVANPAQIDADGDGYGNLCDADLNNSGLVTATDFNLLRSCLNLPALTSPLCAAADMNGSGTVTSVDYALLRSRINTAPGPSDFRP